MPSLMELVERINRGDLIDPALLQKYEDSSNSAEKFLAHHAHATLDLRQAQEHMLCSLEAIDYADQKVLHQYVSLCGFVGLHKMRTAPMVRFAASAIARREYAAGIEAIQHAVAYDMLHGGAYTADRENSLFIASQYESAARSIGWRNEQLNPWNGRTVRLAYVVSTLVDADDTARAIANLARTIDAKRFKLHVYITEAGVRRDKQQFPHAGTAQPSMKRGRGTLESLTRMKVPCWCAPADCDVLSATREMAIQFARDRIDAAIFDANQSDAICAILSNWEIARAKINLCRSSPLFSQGIDCICYTDHSAFEADGSFCRRRGIDARFILEGIDSDDDLGAVPQRAAYGIPDNAVILATSGTDLDRSVDASFVNSMIEVLRSHPQAVYLLIGEAELAWQKRKFELAGVGKRVGYAGKRRDLPSFLRIADVYVAEHSHPAMSGILNAMSVGCPVIAMAGSEGEHGQTADAIGADMITPFNDSPAFTSRIAQLISDPKQRVILGTEMKSRARQHFGFDETARQIESLCEELLRRNAEPDILQDHAAERISKVA